MDNVGLRPPPSGLPERDGGSRPEIGRLATPSLARAGAFFVRVMIADASLLAMAHRGRRRKPQKSDDHHSNWPRADLDPHEREFAMAIEYNVRISEKQRRLIMRALTTTVANNRRSTSGEVLNDDEWMELISVFTALNPQTADDLPEHCPYRFSCPHVRRSTVHIGR